MAKNTLSNAFRKIDVDQFNEDNFKDDDVPNETSSFGKVNESEIAGLLSKGNASEALGKSPKKCFHNYLLFLSTLCLVAGILLSSAPIGSKDQKDKVSNSTSRVYLKFASSQIEMINSFCINFLYSLSYKLFQDAAFALVLRVLMSVKQNQVESIVKQLDNDQHDLLMKYVYRGFETPTDNSSAHLLFWHEKLFDQGDLGTIVRVMTDRKRV